MSNRTATRTYTLTGADGQPFDSETPGALGGNRRGRIYGQLDCAAALKTLRRGGYNSHRVFFLDEETALSAGYRPCGNCMPAEYQDWKQRCRPPGSDDPG